MSAPAPYKVEQDRRYDGRHCEPPPGKMPRSGIDLGNDAAGNGKRENEIEQADAQDEPGQNEASCSLVTHAVQLLFCDGQSFIKDRAFHVALGCKLLITSLIRVDLQRLARISPADIFPSLCA
jgi:hypothetical protein